MPVPAVRGEIFYLQVMLTSQADTDIFQVDPTIAAGDFLVSTDYGGLVNVDGYVLTGGSAEVRIQLSAAQMTGDIIGVCCHDQLGDEWQDLYVEIRTDSQEIGDIPTAAAIAAAVWVAASRTLTSFGTLVADAASAIWAYASRTLTQSASQVAAAVSGSDIAVNSYVTWTIALTDIGDISDRTALYFTAKADPENDPDSSSIVQIEETAGLQYINGAAPIAAGNGSITVTDAVTGDITVTVAAAETGIGKRQGWYGVKKVSATGVTLMCEGWFTIDAPSPRAIA